MNELTATCKKCDVKLEVGNIDDDASHVTCPECGHDFGKWGDVKVEMKELVKDKLGHLKWITVK